MRNSGANLRKGALIKTRYLPLPELPVRRWGPRNKQAVIEALGRGEITFGQAYRRSDLSPEELDQWLWAYRHRGFVGLFIGKRVPW
jgi:hypothetical protein